MPLLIPVFSPQLAKPERAFRSFRMGDLSVNPPLWVASVNIGDPTSGMISAEGTMVTYNP